MKKKIRFLAIALLCSFTMSSCGVMFGGAKFRGYITAKDHPSAEIYVDGRKEGTGTAKILHPRNQPLRVEIRQEGCETKTQTYYNTFRTGNFILSLVMWGPLGAIIDLATGASFKPAHRNDPEVAQVDYKAFKFMVDYSGCKGTE